MKNMSRNGNTVALIKIIPLSPPLEMGERGGFENGCLDPNN